MTSYQRRGAVLFFACVLSTAIGARPIEGLRAKFPTQQTLTVHYPRSYDEPMIVEAGPQRLVLRAIGDGASFVSDTGEELLLLHDRTAPRVYEWEIVEATGITAAVLDNGAIRFVSHEPQARFAPGTFSQIPTSLQMGRPSIIDATNTRYESAAEWTLIGEGPLPKTIRLTLTTDRLEFPLVITGTFYQTGNMSTLRYGNSSTLLSNGKILVAGGTNNDPLATAELYDPVTGTFTMTGSMTTPRVWHSATLLPNGKVFISGGENDGMQVTTAELYDPATGTFSLTADPPMLRDGHTATLLKNGKVLLVDSNTADIYDPATGTFGTTINTVSAHYDHTATLLQNGKVLIAGGYFNGNIAVAEIYDPATHSFTATGSLIAARLAHSATMLANGKVLITGGEQLIPNGPATTLSSSELYDPSTGMFTTTGSMLVPRWYHSATLLPNGDVLIAGGYGVPASDETAELYDPVAGTFSSTGGLTIGRGEHTATLMTNGRVILIGGAVATAEFYEPDEGSFSTTGSLTTGARYRHTSTLLPNGKVLIAGGAINMATELNTAELYDPATGNFTATGNLVAARFDHTATLLANGKVLIIGGFGPNEISTAELYDPTTGTFTATGSLSMSEHTATLLPSGKVLVVSGTEAWLYDPAAGSFSPTGAPITARFQATATLLRTGKVLITGGYGPPFFDYLMTAELYDPITGTFSPGGFMATNSVHRATLLPDGKVLLTGSGEFAELYDPVSALFIQVVAYVTARDGGHSATLLRNGKVLVAGGYYGPEELTAAELYDPVANIFTETDTLNVGRETHTATLLPNGKVLLTGGNADTDSLTATAELFDAGQGFAESRRPVISSAPSSLTQPGTITLTGTAFRGDSESASGMSNASASNIPVLQLQRVDNDQMLFLGASTSWSDTSFTSPTFSGMPAGYYRVSILTNGIPSIQRLISFANPGTPPQISISDAIVTEGNSGTTTATFTVSLSAPGGEVSVKYATADGTATSASTFTNPEVISIPEGGTATPYPSTINVSGISGTVTKVTVTLNGFSHTYAQDVDMLLVGPGGQSVVLMSDIGSSSAPSNVTLTFDDSASNFLPSAPFTSGTYKPTNLADGEGADDYPPPAPGSGYGSALSVFNAVSPNGTWSLYIVDDVGVDWGGISGWTLTIATKPDYVSTSGTLTFPMGTTSRTISVDILGDTSLEPNETFFVNLTNAMNASILDAQGQGTITNDDTTPDAPTNVVAAATSTTNVNVMWSAADAVSSYRVYRGQRTGGSIVYSLVGSPSTTSFNDTTASPGVAYLYKVRSFAGVESPDSNLDLATTIMFTDPTLTNTTPVKLVHFTQLLTAVNAVRTLAGLSASSFTAPTPAMGVTVRRQHVTDLRTALNGARATLALPTLSFTDPTLNTTTKIKTVHLTQLRTGVN